ncbi:MAG TPA: hypothetical protein VMT10_04365 [Solirubrobacteraceae bacterium]|nr:hypothetical protein [Solirubrobacteraceae bacterium]
MRRITILSLAAVSALALSAAPAFAVTSKQSIVAKVSPSKAGTAKKPANVALTVEPKVALNASDSPFATTNAVILLDKNLKFGGAKFKSCTAGQVQTGKCSSAAKVGSGTAQGQALGLAENLKITAYNGPGGTSLLMRVQGDSPLTIDTVLVGKLSSASGAYGKKLTVAIPDDLQQPAPGVFATLLDFKLTVKGTSGTTPYVGLTRPTAGGLKFAGTFSYTDGSTQNVTTTA